MSFRNSKQPPVIPQVGNFFYTAGRQVQTKIELLPGPPAPRFWFIDQSGSPRVQIQRDFFRQGIGVARLGRQEYPRFDSVREPFERDAKLLSDYVVRQGWGEIQPVQAEVSYINPIHPIQYTRLSSFLRHWNDVHDDFLPSR